jgi:ferrous iron transport protein A
VATLETLKHKGDRGRIVDIQGEDGIAIRLMEMGLTAGEEIKLLGFAPLGDPIEYEIRGYRISLRKAEAARVEIEPLS